MSESITYERACAAATKVGEMGAKAVGVGKSGRGQWCVKAYARTGVAIPPSVDGVPMVVTIGDEPIVALGG